MDHRHRTQSQIIFRKSLLIILCLFIFLDKLAAQDAKQGKVIVEKFTAPSLLGNRAKEDPVRRLTVYLPPGYDESKQRYPVIYFLHGFLMNDSLMIAWNGLIELMNTAIVSGHIRPIIMVVPDSDNNFGGGLYTNSTLTGNWADFIAKDVVSRVDQKYRTIPNRDSRGLSGHSMGGHGALKIGMLYPDVFGAVYAMSPAVLGWAAEFTLNSPAFKQMPSFKNAFTGAQINESLMNGDPDFRKKFYAKQMADLARSYSPDDGKTFLSASMPVSYIGDKMIINKEVEKKWEYNFPINMIDRHLEALKSLRALKIEWGRNDEAPHIPITCLQFSKKLEANGVKHFAEEFLGGHVDKLSGLDGRIYTEMLPFFDAYLKFED
jgi:S-formylglutathione hydrolase FrmB